MPTDDNLDPVKIEFVQYHLPVLDSGAYEITVQQQIHTNETGVKKIDETVRPVVKSFSVLGPRFELTPADVYSVFPPPGSLGEHSNVLPHVILSRSTLPWERQAFESQTDINPWLALLVFDDNEAPTPTVVRAGDLGVTLEPGQHADDQVTVIDVAKELLQAILTDVDGLKLLAHVRQGVDASGNVVGDELSVVIANRLPQKAGSSVAHLVSVEKLFSGDSFNFAGHPGDSIRLVSLKSWIFACVDKKQDFKGLLHALRVGSLRLPANGNQQAENYFKLGCVPLPHFMREGDRTVSWFHSPLSVGSNLDEFPLPAAAADQLVRYNPANGMFDVSYAAAWELGRLLALQSKQLSISLYNWKRAAAQLANQTKQLRTLAYLPGQKKTTDNNSIPDDISSWFRRLSLLQGVPFNYLVPDEQMLAAESIRFVWLDRFWIDCLLDGAFSIGRVTSADQQADKGSMNSPATNPYPNVSGFILRSEVVPGWPSLLADAYDQADTGGNQLNLLRMERLSSEVLICLYEGEMKRVEIHQKPEALHFGLDVGEQPPFSFSKIARDAQSGQPVKDNSGQIDLATDSKLWQAFSKRVLNIPALATGLQTASKTSGAFTSAQFALQMIEGVEKVIFQSGA